MAMRRNVRGAICCSAQWTEVAAAFLGQWAVPLARQRVRALEELLEHSRTSTIGEMGGRSDYTGKELCGVQPPGRARIPAEIG